MAPTLTRGTAVAVYRLVRVPLGLKLADIRSRAHGLPDDVRASLGLRAVQALTVALDHAVACGRDERPLTTNGFMEALAARWSPTYAETRARTGSGKLWNFRAETVVRIRDELVRAGIDYRAIWRVVRAGVPGLYRTALVPKRGRTVDVVEGTLLSSFDALLAADRRTPRRGRLLLTTDPMPPRKIAQRVAGEQPFDVMPIGPATEATLQRLESARVFLAVDEVQWDHDRYRARLDAHPWREHRRAWDELLVTARPQLAAPVPALAWRSRAEARFWARFWTGFTRKVAQAHRRDLWRAFLTPERDAARNDYRSTKGRLAAVRAILEQVRERAPGEWPELKSGFFKHVTRRYQAMNVWPSEASSGEAIVRELPPDVAASFVLVAEYATGAPPGSIPAPTRYVQPQRARWFRVRQWDPPKPWREAELEPLTGLDVSGSQAQLLAVAMGLRDVERELATVPFKQLVATSMQLLHDKGRIQLAPELLADRARLENVAKGVALPGLYGAAASNAAKDTQRDPEQYGPGVDGETATILFDEVPVLRQLFAFLPVARAVGEAAYAKDPAAGVRVVDPLDGTAFTWNPLRRRQRVVGSGDFKLQVGEPVEVPGGYQVDRHALVRRIAPGLIHMLDAVFAALVVYVLDSTAEASKGAYPRVRDVVSIHDAFLVPASAYGFLQEAMDAAARLWLPQLGPFFDVLTTYLPEDTEHGAAARRWRRQWQQRVEDCQAGRDTWPTFRTKREGDAYA